MPANVVQSVTSCTPSALLHAIASLKYGEYDAPNIHRIPRWIYYAWNPVILRSLFRRIHGHVLFLFHIANFRMTFAHPRTHTRAKEIRYFLAKAASCQLPHLRSPLASLVHSIMNIKWISVNQSKSHFSCYRCVVTFESTSTLLPFHFSKHTHIAHTHVYLYTSVFLFSAAHRPKC